MNEHNTSGGLTEALHRAFHEHWDPSKSLNLYVDSPLWQEQAAAVERILAARAAEHAAEVDKAREDGYGEGKDEAETRDLNYDALTARAESAEAENARLRARLEAVEALAANVVADFGTVCCDNPNNCGCSMDRLRAALDSPTSLTQQEAEVGADGYGPTEFVAEEHDCDGSDEHPLPCWPACATRADALAADTTGEPS